MSRSSILSSWPILVQSFTRDWQLPFLNQKKGENYRSKYFMITLHERPYGAGPGRGQTPDLLITSQTRMLSTAEILVILNKIICVRLSQIYIVHVVNFMCDSHSSEVPIKATVMIGVKYPVFIYNTYPTNSLASFFYIQNNFIALIVDMCKIRLELLQTICIATDKMLFFSPKVLIFFLFLHENICCGASNEYPQHTFSWRNKKNIYLTHPLI